MPLTKSDLIQALNQQRKEITAEIGKFLEKHVIEPIFDLEKGLSGLKKNVLKLQQDMSEVKHDVSGLKQDASGLKQDVSGLKQGMEKIETELEGKASTTLVNNVEESILNRIDKFEENVGEKFQGHEKRISHLEEATYV